MRFSLEIIGFAMLQVASALAVPVSHNLSPRATVLPPTEDPFYTPPDGLADEEPGTILRTRSIGELSFQGVVPFTANASYQLMYRTTDSLGNASAAVTTIIVPENANTSRVLSYQFAEDAAWLNCAPSYVVQLGSDPDNFGSNGLETLFIIAALDQGWIVNLPDYEGLQSAFTSGIQAGQATLDSVRAALASGNLTTISPEAEYQIWGYSGGSLASEWAAELQPTYAPELNFKGVALGGLVPNVTSILLTINKSLFAGLIPAGILGLGNAYPELEAYINEHLYPANASTFKEALTQCLAQDTITYAGQDLFSYFDEGEATLFTPIPQSVLAATGQMGAHGTPQMPVYAYKAIADEISPVADTDELVAKLCAQGANIQYVRDRLGEHATEEITGSGDAFGFLVDRFNGVEVTPGCTTTDVLSDTLSGSGLVYLGTEVVDALLAILGEPVGDYID
ncbi:secretory lipase-like protein 1 precursor [Mollisia scopiformis]|uniref:Secretory lipase-like protein 1 n=1 Tax=Mollisia scopiformis TaxID=149040 RepID=A0A194XKW7_MOLSC|nr:secretory lipase-like protein 1 precursor [Mollisia scopiformis]KUJ20739.1 secretory lipase-like protein 1 precursor [Mollisia scopiformis]